MSAQAPNKLDRCTAPSPDCDFGSGRSSSCSATCEKQKLAVFICAGQHEEDLLRAVKGRGSRSDSGCAASRRCTGSRAVCCRLQVSLPTEILRLPDESADEQFARVPTQEQASGVIAACKDYMTLQKRGQLGTWADKILGMGPAGTAKRAAALGAWRKSAVQVAAMSEEVDGTRRLELMNAIAAMLHKAASAPAWESDADRRFALTVAKCADAPKSGAHRH